MIRRLHGKPSSKQNTGRDNQQNLKKYPVKTSWKPNMVSIEWFMKMVAYLLNKNNYRVPTCARIHTREKNLTNR